MPSRPRRSRSTTPRRTGGRVGFLPDPGPGPCWVEPDHHAIGRSRGGLTTKLHMLTDGQGRPLVLLLTPGNVNDCPTFPQLINGLSVARAGAGRPRPDRTTSSATRATAPGPTASCCAGAVSRTPSPNPVTSSPAPAAASHGGRPVGFDNGATHGATSSSEASTSSKNGAAWQAAPTNTPSTTAARSPSAPPWPGFS